MENELIILGLKLHQADKKPVYLPNIFLLKSLEKEFVVYQGTLRFFTVSIKIISETNMQTNVKTSVNC